MRRLIFILMIALLPLRGWMGEAMATEMAAINLVAVQATNTPAITIFTLENKVSQAKSAQMHADCDLHAAAQSGDSGADLASDHACTHCQACHAVGLTSLVQPHSTHTLASALPDVTVTFFASADLALRQKPPIL
ncbi:MAG: hypothetical protein Q7T07_10315 [Burkholderiaceae bacterium]|nr:hypothetical protein [Burkholderiaceae bacterium]